MKKPVVITAVAVTVLATAGVLGFTWTSRAKPQPDQPPAAPKTVAVTKTDLADYQDFKASLGFGAAQQVTGRKAGTLTWLPAPGGAVDRGQPLYKVDNRPVWLFFGDTPLWRKLDTPGLKGPDVKILKENLAALGFNAGAGEEFTPATVDAVKRWQKAQKVEETGLVDPGEVVVLPGKMRIDSVPARLSTSAEGVLMSVTTPDKAISASVEATQVDVFKKDMKVTVILPSGKETTGTVRGVSTTVQEEKTGDGQAAATVAVDIGLDDPAAVGDLNTGPVRLRVAATTRKGVLAVPVTALLALREGGYAVQAPDGKLIAVKIGLFAGGMVEMSGGGIGEGVQVVTTS